jgi:NhaC family Na+:H+ antiporter
MEDEKFIKDTEEITENKELNIWEALFPVFALIAMLAYNVFVYGDDALSGSNQFILLMGGAVAAVVGIFNKVSFDKMIEEVALNIKSTTGAILILLMVGSLAGTWLVSGIIPTMIYYGLQILNPTIFCGDSLNRNCRCARDFSRNDSRGHTFGSLFWG